MAADLVVVKADAFAQAAAAAIAQAIVAASRDWAKISVALSGGRSPRPVYQELARMARLPWKAIDLFFTDERAVPPADARSNYRLVQETLGSCFAGRPGSIHRMEADRLDLERAAAEYESILPTAFDVLVLGLGEDGHTASLFPHHPAVREEQRRVVGISTPASPPERMTITPPVIRAARATLLLAAGDAKAAAVAQARSGVYDPFNCPAQLAREGQWILDSAAASRIRPAAS